jgi:hypothetical protein
MQELRLTGAPTPISHFVNPVTTGINKCFFSAAAHRSHATTYNFLLAVPRASAPVAQISASRQATFLA